MDELIKDARIIADSIHVHSSFQDWEAAEKDTLNKCADAIERLTAEVDRKDKAIQGLLTQIDRKDKTIERMRDLMKHYKAAYRTAYKLYQEARNEQQS